MRHSCGPILLCAVLFCAACTSAAPAVPSGANATIEALSAQVERLQATMVEAIPTATIGPIATTSPATETLEATVEPEATTQPARAAVVPTRTPRVITAEDAAPCGLGQIKGNRSSRIYHVPGGGSYSQTKANVVCFETEAAAEAAGYRRARN